jgi:threonine dehydratase
MRLDEATARRGIVTHSSGNHAAAAAFAAARRGIPCVVVMPRDAPPTKVRAVRGYGAEIVPCDRAEREAICERIRGERGMTLIHPYEYRDVIAGQGTAALELLEQAGPFDVVLAPVGGGGLMAGTTIAVRAASPETEVWAAEPQAVDDAYRSMESGVHQPGVEQPRSWADGLLTRLGRPAFAVMRREGVRVVTVTEAEMLQANWDFVQRVKLVVEPSAATVLAALRRVKGELRDRRIGAILSGGNTDFSWLSDPSLAKE